jgi:uncharacterized RDD family membrane protein YckC
MAFRNPHATGPDQPVVAATRWSRLVARVIDTLVWFAPLPLLVFPCLGAMVALSLLVAIFIGQIWLLVTQGQTIGKKFMKIYIMRDDGDIPSVAWLLAREFAIPVTVALFRYAGHNDPSPIGQAFQFLLCFIWLIDVLFIFGPTRRCLHDFVAGTHVVMAE